MQGVPRPLSPEMLGALQRAVQAHNKGSLDEAKTLYNHVLANDNGNFAALNMLGILLGQQRNYDEAIRLIERALKVNPQSAEACANLAHLHFEKGELEQAAAGYLRALAIKPDFALAHSNYSGVLRSLGRPHEALSHCDQALTAQPNFVNALNNRGNALFDLRRYEDALAAYESAMLRAPNLPQAWLGRGNCLMALSHHVEAKFAYEKSIELNGRLAEAWLGRGNSLTALRRHVDAHASYEKALAINPNLGDAWLGIGNVLLAQRRYDAAGAAFQRAVAANPNSAKARLAIATVMQALRRYDETIAACDGALALDPAATGVEGVRFLAKLNICDWRTFDTDRSQLVAGVNRGAPVALPFVMLCATSASSVQLKCAQRFAGEAYARALADPQRRDIGTHDRLNVAYVSGDFREHAVSLLMADLFERHDRSKIRTIAISFGPDDQSKMRDRLKRSFETFIDVDARSDSEVATLMRELDVDIAVDLMGHTEGSRTEILARRPAPIQVNYLGYPGTMGARFIDYIIADHFVIPREQRDHYAEKIVYLPDTFQANDGRRPSVEHAPSRAAHGIPSDAFVFCSFNATQKITPTMFDVWMRLLRGVERSVLWLVANDRGVEGRLRQEAAARGVGAERLLFAPRANYVDYLNRYRCADLFLDTLPFNGGTTVSDALWAGLPVLACSGEAYASRMAGSLMRTAGVPELVTDCLQEYENLALVLAKDPAMLADIKARLSLNRGTCTLFDTDRFRRHIESAYRVMYERYRRGEQPEHLDVATIDIG